MIDNNTHRDKAGKEIRHFGQYSTVWNWTNGQRKPYQFLTKTQHPSFFTYTHKASEVGGSVEVYAPCTCFKKVSSSHGPFPNRIYSHPKQCIDFSSLTKIFLHGRCPTNLSTRMQCVLPYFTWFQHYFHMHSSRRTESIPIFKQYQLPKKSLPVATMTTA